MSLQSLRFQRALSVRALARLAGLSPTTIMSIEHGHNPPRVDTIRKLAQALGVEPLAITDDLTIAEAKMLLLLIEMSCQDHQRSYANAIALGDAVGEARHGPPILTLLSARDKLSDLIERRRRSRSRQGPTDDD